MISTNAVDRVVECVLGQLVNFFANDCQRLFELMYLLPMCLGGPILIIASTIYCINYIGLWALIGSLVMLLYYPYQVYVCPSIALSVCVLCRVVQLDPETGPQRLQTLLLFLLGFLLLSDFKSRPY